jgi:hypothetical protein
LQHCDRLSCSATPRLQGRGAERLARRDQPFDADFIQDLIAEMDNGGWLDEDDPLTDEQEALLEGRLDDMEKYPGNPSPGKATCSFRTCSPTMNRSGRADFHLPAPRLRQAGVRPDCGEWALVEQSPPEERFMGRS